MVSRSRATDEHGSVINLPPVPLDSTRSSVLRSVRDNWTRVLIGALVFGLLGVIFNVMGAPTYEATAEMVVSDPRAANLAELPGVADPVRYVADQVEILRTYVIADRAAALLREDGFDADLSAEDFSSTDGRLSIISTETSNVIRITYRASDQNLAVAGANAVVEAHQILRRDEASRTYQSALEQIDSRISDVDQELTDIAAAIQAQIPPETSQLLNQQSITVLNRLLELQGELLETTSAEAQAAIVSDILALTEPVQAMSSLLQNLQPPEVQALLTQQNSLIGRRVELMASRDSIIVSSELSAGGVNFLSPASIPERAGFGFVTAFLLAGLIGAILTASLVHWVSTRRGRAEDPRVVREILGIPHLGTIPRFADENLKTSLPVKDEPRSGTAESFRFVATSVHTIASRDNLKTIAVVGGSVGDGKSTVAANLGIAMSDAAGRDSRILLVDADFGSQRLTQLFDPGYVGPGITEVGMGTSFVESAARLMPRTGGGALYLVSRGMERIDAPSFFAGSAFQFFLDAVRRHFDLIIIDTPPLLQVAYASVVAQAADGALVTVPHRAYLSDIVELPDRLDLAGINQIGFLYSRAPVTPRMLETQGSMADVLGEKRH